MLAVADKNRYGALLSTKWFVWLAVHEGYCCSQQDCQASEDHHDSGAETTISYMQTHCFSAVFSSQEAHKPCAYNRTNQAAWLRWLGLTAAVYSAHTGLDPVSFPSLSLQAVEIHCCLLQSSHLVPWQQSWFLPTHGLLAMTKSCQLLPEWR